jgi:hypothetical protein
MIARDKNAMHFNEHLQGANDFSYIIISDGVLVDPIAAQKVFCQGRSVAR